MARTMSKYSPSKERDQIWKESLEIAEKFEGKSSKNYLDVFCNAGIKSSRQSTFEILKLIEKEFEEKSMTNTLEHAHCFSKIADFTHFNLIDNFSISFALSRYLKFIK